MAVPWNIRGSASQLFYQDKQSPEYNALHAMSDLPHPDRSMLGSFVNDAVDPGEAASYFLRVTSPQDDTAGEPEYTISRLLSEWKVLVEKFRPTRAQFLSTETKGIVFEREGGCCCISGTPFKSLSAKELEFAYIVPPSVFADPNLSEGTVQFDMLCAFLSKKKLLHLRSLLSTTETNPSESLDNIWLLSGEIFDAVKDGEIFFSAQSRLRLADKGHTQNYIVGRNKFNPRSAGPLPMSTTSIRFENKASHQASALNEELLDTHARFSTSLAWIQNTKYLDTDFDGDTDASKGLGPSFAPWLFRLLRTMWIALPRFVRVSVYDCLLWAGTRLYGTPLSMTVRKLPLGLYLRKGSPALAAKLEVEAHTLRIVEKFTRIPAPRAIDNLSTSRFSYLLMTCVPGRPIGRMLHSMTDEQVAQVVTDLQGYISELRRIPNNTGEFRICNSKGGGILDWRIPDSQREDLRYKSEADFNEYLTDSLPDDARKRAAMSHDVKHDIVFTHGDLNPRNILAVNGKVTGIVDWENAGWFPEYWEYTKSHYAVRSVIRWLADVVDRVFEGYREELYVENMISDLMGPF